MKGLILLFLVVTLGLLSWSYIDPEPKAAIKKFVSRNLWTVVAGALAVAIAIVLSVNTTLRLV